MTVGWPRPPLELSLRLACRALVDATPGGRHLPAPSGSPPARGPPAAGAPLRRWGALASMRFRAVVPWAIFVASAEEEGASLSGHTCLRGAACAGCGVIRPCALLLGLPGCPSETRRAASHAPSRRAGRPRRCGVFLACWRRGGPETDGQSQAFGRTRSVGRSRVALPVTTRDGEAPRTAAVGGGWRSGAG